mmetsp:Transcript_31174/g.52609  ORF Transcript_31174/g.52609 Transcript_31174/m.52609 type:complete len:877 (+) Transcript_31174:43-2673(+)
MILSSVLLVAALAVCLAVSSPFGIVSNAAVKSSLGDKSKGEFSRTVNMTKEVPNVECVDGVCSIKPETSDLSEKVISEWQTAEANDDVSGSSSITGDVVDLASSELPTATTTKQVESEEDVQTLISMGWTEADARRALKVSKQDVAGAAMLLEQEEEEHEILLNKSKELVNAGWDDSVALTAVQQCEGNITAAGLLLEQEEMTIQTNFNNAVQDMVKNGWEEVVARQALLAQWSIDQRKAAGGNVTIDEQVLQSIKPSLRKVNETTESGKTSTASATGISSKSSKSAATKPKQQEGPPPAKKEDVVFDVTASNFQKVVLESPVPVLVDVYADWCGPCKQLGPILEQAAVKAGGMFRLAKVNSDEERSISSALGVSGLPTVFTVSNGKFADRFVGMLPQDQLQTFVVRAISGYGERVQGKDISEKELEETTQKMTIMAGMASISFKKKEKLYQLVQGAMELDGAYAEGSNFALSQGVKTALLYIDNLRRDIRNAKFRKINTSSKAYAEKVYPSEAAMALLDIAGFKMIKPSSTSASSTPAASTTTEATTSEVLEVIHSNGAILTLVAQKVNEIVSDKKFARMKSTGSQMPARSKSLRRRSSETATTTTTTTTTPKSTAAETKKAPAAASMRSIKKSSDEIVVSLRDSSQEGTRPFSINISQDKTLKQAVEQLLKDASSSAATTVNDIEVLFPAPRRRLSDTSSELNSILRDVVGTSGDSVNLSVVAKEGSNAGGGGLTAGGKRILSKNKKKALDAATATASAKGKKQRGNTNKTHTLFSTGILGDSKKKKHVEYFGGDSTVVLSRKDDEEDEEEEDDESSEKEEKEHEEVKKMKPVVGRKEKAMKSGKHTLLKKSFKKKKSNTAGSNHSSKDKKKKQ